jgi:20S proteasome alpha/beta subunit
MQPAVDTSYLHFDESGAVPAIKFARIAVSMGLPIVAVHDGKTVAVATVNRDGNPLATGSEKSIRVSKDCVVLVTGHGGDSNQVRQVLGNLAVNHKFVLGSEVSPKEVSLSLSDYLHELGMSYRRPLGVGIIVAGFDQQGKIPVIYHCDVDGNATERAGIALGRETGEAESSLREALKAGKTDAVTMAQKAAEATIKAIKESSTDMAELEFRVDVDVLTSRR